MEIFEKRRLDFTKTDYRKGRFKKGEKSRVKNILERTKKNEVTKEGE